MRAKNQSPPDCVQSQKFHVIFFDVLGSLFWGVDCSQIWVSKFLYQLVEEKNETATSAHASHPCLRSSFHCDWTTRNYPNKREGFICWYAHAFFWPSFALEASNGPRKGYKTTEVARRMTKLTSVFADWSHNKHRKSVPLGHPTLYCYTLTERLETCLRNYLWYCLF